MFAFDIHGIADDVVGSHAAFRRGDHTTPIEYTTHWIADHGGGESDAR